MVDPLTSKELARAQASLGLSDDHQETYRALVESLVSVATAIDGLPEPSRLPSPGERSFERPAPDENPLGAWWVKTDIRGKPDGKLAGRTVAVKDNLLLAGVPLMNGTHVLEGYVPDIDAEIITRMLAAGATITGKSVCEAYCFSGGSHTSATGPVLNPHRSTHSAGGSSSGSAALVASGDVDMAIGCDQGGSVRIPASFCGIVGLKPTFGLIPYTGILGMSPMIDHTGPMTRNVADNALLLEVLSGPDGVDTRQPPVEPPRYTDSLQEPIDGLRIGILDEGFGLDSSEPEVDEMVREAAHRFADLGAEVSEVSIPMHTLTGVVVFGLVQTAVESMFGADGCLLERPECVPASYVEKQHGWRDQVEQLPPNLKVLLLMSEVMRQRYGHRYVALAQERLAGIRKGYDQALTKLDVLVMPTTPMKAPPLPPADAPPEVIVDQAFAPLTNTSPFNNTHHPALSIPCGSVDGLPVGMMLVGRHFDESTLYKAAHAFEVMTS